MRLGTIIVLAGLCLVAYCAIGRLPDPPSVARDALPPGILGCWALYDNKGKPVRGGDYYWSPGHVRLDSTPRPSSYDRDPGVIRRAIRLGPLPLHPGAPVGEEWNVWTVDSLADTVRIEFAPGFGSGYPGTEFILALPSGRRQVDTLRGRAVAHFRIGPLPRRIGRASAVRVPCPA